MADANVTGYRSLWLPSEGGGKGGTGENLPSLTIPRIPKLLKDLIIPISLTLLAVCS